MVLPAFAESPKRAAAFLVKDVKRYDPTVLPETSDMKETVKALRGQYKDDLEKALLKVKRDLLKKRFERYSEAVETIGKGDGEAAAKALCGVFALASARVDEADAARDACERAWQDCVIGYDPEQTNHTLKKNTRPTYQRNRTNAQVWRDFAYGMLGLRIECARPEKQTTLPAPTTR